MSWKHRLAVLFATALPAFSGYPLRQMPGELVAGVPIAWVVYFVAAQVVILLVSGPRLHALTLSIAALITLPVVFVGAAVSYLLLIAGWPGAASQALFSAHYVTLCLTMLTVVPLALNMVAAVPFHELEQYLLKAPGGVSRPQKMALMFVRVFNHIVFFVIPGILEVVREERRLHPGGASPEGTRPAAGRVALLRDDLTQIAIEGICASIQYIPIWAVEISRLPAKERKTP
jgi:hypothetical protein